MMRRPFALTRHDSGEPLSLDYFVRWHTWLWKPAVRAVLDDPRRFVGKRVLELGCGDGKMSCLFGLLGANVTSVEMRGKSLDSAKEEIAKWDLQQQVRLQHYDGDVSCLGACEYDFVFSKSVLVIVPELKRFVAAVKLVLRPDGRLLAVENMQRGTALRKIRAHVLHAMAAGHWGADSYARFRGVTPEFLSTLGESLKIVRFRTSYGLVAAIEATRGER